MVKSFNKGTPCPIVQELRFWDERSLQIVRVDTRYTVYRNFDASKRLQVYSHNEICCVFPCLVKELWPVPSSWLALKVWLLFHPTAWVRACTSGKRHPIDSILHLQVLLFCDFVSSYSPGPKPQLELLHLGRAWVVSLGTNGSRLDSRGWLCDRCAGARKIHCKHVFVLTNLIIMINNLWQFCGLRW